ncbi:MAG: hypothetical protein N3A66_06210, partial [Planctomycetota bacterium]|nr:hypothetical protein [Planctomycetota bacterium]
RQYETSPLPPVLAETFWFWEVLGDFGSSALGGRLAAEYRPGDCPLIIGEVIAAHVNVKAERRRLYTVAKGHRLGGVVINEPFPHEPSGSKPA